jgi:hypothetical protein
MKPLFCPKALILLTVFILLSPFKSLFAVDIGVNSRDLNVSVQFLPYQESLLKTDFDFLKTLGSWEGLTDLDRKTMDIKVGNSAELDYWLRKRVQFLIPMGLNLKLDFYGEETLRSYPNITEPPPNMENIFTMEDEQSNTLMSNIGVGFYLFGKQQNQIISVNLRIHFPKIEPHLPILTPRIGIIQVHKNSFSHKNRISISGREPADRLLRLSFLFHEGRHSDGNASSLGFYHSKCPPGHDYTGRMACDISSNGAYAVAALFLKKSIEVCHSCTEGHKESLKLSYLDSRIRVLDKLILTPEEIERVNRYENDMNIYARQLFAAIAQKDDIRQKHLMDKLQEVNAKIHKIKKPQNIPKTYWKSEPETVEYNNGRESI